MKKLWFSGGSIAASGTQISESPIRLARARTVSFTVGVTFHGSATGDARVDVFTTPNMNDWDTIVYTSFDLAVTAGNYVQRTVVVDPVEHGGMKIHIVNEDQSYAIANHKAWYGIGAHLPYPDWETLARGELKSKTELD